jgi:hypothetical protein
VEETTVRHARSVEGFVAARLWDHECLNQDLVRAGRVEELAFVRSGPVRLVDLQYSAGTPTGSGRAAMSLSDLRTSLWSNEPRGEVLLDQIRGK